MTPSSSHSSMTKMAPPQRTSSHDSTSDAIRKRVCKACDRCRLKKSKCDGSSPCSRCKSDNAICYFGERKKSHDRVYPKGYVEMLEQQQTQLVSGIQEMYKRLVAADAWTGSQLAESNGSPLTHDILSALDLLEARHDGEAMVFEEDFAKLQERLLDSEDGAVNHHQRASISSESEHSQHSHARTNSRGTPVLSNTGLFKDDFGFSHAPVPKDNFIFDNQTPTFDSAPSSSNHSPVPRQTPGFTAPQQVSMPQTNSPFVANDPQLYQAQWAYQDADTKYMMRSDFAIQTPDIDQNMLMGSMQYNTWAATSAPFDMSTTAMTYQNQNQNLFGHNGYQNDAAQMEVDYAQFIKVQN